VRRLAACCALVLLVGCAAAPADDGRELTVFAAASLGSAFERMAVAFEAAHPDIAVRLNVAGSRTLVAQLGEGARADVLATADTASMEAAVAAGVIAADPVPLATNTAAVAVPVGDPAGVRSARDLAEPDRHVVTCAVPVPCGIAARELLANLQLAVVPVSEETSVAGVLGKVAMGEADAGIVYATDVAGEDAVRSIPLPAGAAVTTAAPIATVTDAGPAAEVFVAFVLGAEGQRILAAAGFGPP
jgi:molybdate transport system substrate-binding protein